MKAKTSSSIKNLHLKQSKAGKEPIDVAQPKYQSFFEDVWDVVRQIPKGRVTNYGAIANYLGTKMSARMVGWAMNAAHNAQPPVPAQRVVNRNGMLSGKAHFPTLDAMENMLKKEGVKVEKDTIVNFEKHHWDPAKELDI